MIWRGNENDYIFSLTIPCVNFPQHFLNEQRSAEKTTPPASFSSSHKDHRPKVSRATASPGALQSVLNELEMEDNVSYNSATKVSSRETASPSMLHSLMEQFAREGGQDKEEKHTSPHDLMEGESCTPLRAYPPISVPVCPDSGIPITEMMYHMPRTPLTRVSSPAI